MTVPYRYTDPNGDVSRTRPYGHVILRDRRITRLKALLAETGTELADATDDALTAAAAQLGVSVNTVKRYRFAAWKRREGAR